MCLFYFFAVFFEEHDNVYRKLWKVLEVNKLFDNCSGTLTNKKLTVYYQRLVIAK